MEYAYVLDIVIGCESAPFPSTFCPETVTLMPLGSGRHIKDEGM